MRILGISCYFHDSAAVLLEDGVLIAAAEEERFTRKKHDYDFPHHAIEFCLTKAGVTGKDIDYAVFFEKPFSKFDRLLRTSLQGFPKTFRLFEQSMRTWLMDKLWIKSLIGTSLGIEKDRILFSDHHLSHAASSYFCSPFEEAAVVTFDGVGEWSTTTVGVGKGSDLTLTHEQRFPHSLGLLYSAFTAFLGFEVNEGEYKVMGMAPYGHPIYKDSIWKTVHRFEGGSYWLDPDYYSSHNSVRVPYTRKFLDLFGEPRNDDFPFFTESSGYSAISGSKPANFLEMCQYNQRYADIAASIQSVTEDLILDVVNQAHLQTGSKNLCLAGGVALNSVANGRILRETAFEKLYIQPSAGDGGGALGAALYAWHCALGNQKRFVMDHAYWGAEYDVDEVRSAAEAAGLKTHVIEDDSKLTDFTVDRLAKGHVTGWFQGRFEWGPRALGNRSILADPRSAATKDVVNTKIKYREPFRPFAPAVPVESVREFIDLKDTSNDHLTRFMLMVAPVREEKQDIIPAVSHMGTARVQTVHQEMSPRFHQLIEKFGQSTGVPVLLNTSFNVKGEPVVNTPTDAINTFLNSGIDSLVMGNCMLDKS